MEKIGEIWQAIVDFMTGDISLLNLNLKMWMIFAIGAALILIVLIVILVISDARRKKKHDGIVMETGHTEQESEPEPYSTQNPENQILSIGDEPTVNLDEQIGNDNGIVMVNDEETQDLVRKTQYLVQVQMHYNGLVSEKRPILDDMTAEIVFGRDEGATVVTNPEDKSVSRRHGVITLKAGEPWYTNESKNGTILNNSRTLGMDESVKLPLTTKIQLDMGRHKVLLFIIRQGVPSTASDF